MIIVGAITLPDTEFQRGNGPVLFNEMRCRGLEHNLLDCTHSGLEITCPHGRIAGVACMEGTYAVIVLVFTK